VCNNFKVMAPAGAPTAGGASGSASQPQSTGPKGPPDSTRANVTAKFERLKVKKNEFPA
jgi:hypothetical protein